MKIKLLASLFLIGSVISLKAQTIVISDEEPDKIYQETNWGPNKQHFGYYFVNYGIPVPLENSGNLKIHTSGHWNIGYAYNLKLLKFVDIGLELSYSNYFFELNEDSREKIDGTEDSWDKIRTKQNGLKSNIYFRFYLNPRRGNYFGPFIDVGMYLDYYLSSGFKYKRKDDNIKELISTKQNGDFEQITYGPSFSFGRNQLSIFGQYNLSSVFIKNFVEDSDFPLMPKYVFGLKLNLYSSY